MMPRIARAIREKPSVRPLDALEKATKLELQKRSISILQLANKLGKRLILHESFSPSFLSATD
ncbi:hypothetical protein AKJ16_DCAP15114 [Drosera capensis]